MPIYLPSLMGQALLISAAPRHASIVPSSEYPTRLPQRQPLRACEQPPPATTTTGMAPLLPAIASLFLLLLLLCLPAAPPGAAAATADPTPTPWPPQFHAKLIMDYHGNMSVADLWYDWPGGRNLHVIRYQLAYDAPYYDNEWNNGTSFFYTPARRACRSAAVGVGILRPDWLLPGAVYLGRRGAGGLDCHVWAKADFITYYEDVDTKRPVKWVFYTGRTAYVMSFEVGAVLEDAAWQAPEYCFGKDGEIAGSTGKISQGHDNGFIPRARRVL